MAESVLCLTNVMIGAINKFKVYSFLDSHSANAYVSRVFGLCASNVCHWLLYKTSPLSFTQRCYKRLTGYCLERCSRTYTECYPASPPRAPSTHLLPNVWRLHFFLRQGDCFLADDLWHGSLWLAVRSSQLHNFFASRIQYLPGRYLRPGRFPWRLRNITMRFFHSRVELQLLHRGLSSFWSLQGQKGVGALGPCCSVSLLLFFNVAYIVIRLPHAHF